MSNPTDLARLDAFLDQAAALGRTMLLPALHFAQSEHGWLPAAVQEHISRRLRVPLADVHGVIEFYSMFYNEPTARRVVRVCEDSACHLAGAPALMRALEGAMGVARHGETTVDGELTYEHVPCLGMCELAPVALAGDRPAGHLTPAAVPAFLAGDWPEPAAQPYGEPRWLLARVGVVRPESLADFEAHGGYTALRKALALTPSELIQFIEGSGIVGRGGAMFPTGRKWRFTRGAPGAPTAKHVVANADESEPGTFKDRVIMEEDPFALIEGMTIAGYAVGAANGWLFVRGEYPRAAARLRAAIAAARAAGYLGENVLGHEGFNFDIELRVGAGAYICGEETALFEAIEGRRGFPRIKPPFPTTHGLFGQPTAVNNVETFASVLVVMNQGIDTWRAHGTENSPGTKLFCLSGHVRRPGIYEVPFGRTIGEMVALAGGVPGDRPVQAILMGGAAGAFVGPESMDMALTYEASRERGVPLGSGVIMVFDDTADLRVAMYQLSRFFAHESCGKCFPCQLGSQRQMEILDRIAGNGGARPDDRHTLVEIGLAMTETSLCGLGQTAASAVISAIELWPELVE